MKVVIQRVHYGEVLINNEIKRTIKKGFVLLVGFGHTDDQGIINKVVDKLVGLRIFDDEEGKMNLSLTDVNGEILSISQFTLYANCKKGRRPSFVDAGKPEYSSVLYDYFNNKIKEKGIHLEQGEFGAQMNVTLSNDGPITIILDSNDL